MVSEGGGFARLPDWVHRTKDTHMNKVDHAIINYRDGSAQVRTYSEGIKTDDYIVHDEDGDPKAGLPKGISLTEVDDRVSPSSTSTSYLGGYGHEYRRGRFVNANEATGVYLGERRDV